MPYFNYKDNGCFYNEYGQGEPIIFLHGNTASSKMFEILMPLYSANYRCESRVEKGRQTAQKSRECKYVANKSHKALLRCLRPL